MDLGNPIAIGNTAKIYQQRDKVIKVFHDHLPNTEAQYEANKQNFAYSCGIFVPEIFDVTEINGKQAIIMEYIKGETIGDLLFKNTKKSEYYMDVAIEIQQRIYMVKTYSPESMIPKLKEKIKMAPSLDEGHKSILIRNLNSIEYENRLCHGDFHPFNLIMSDNKVAVIDWVDSTSGDIRADVYRTYLLYSQFSGDLADMYLNRYCEKSGLQQEEVIQWAPIMAAARLSENVSSENADRLIKIINDYCPL
ncbi:aminoglycoside phosphotransferase [Oceanobacillus arenosus]|uniref:Aminoglycoside phosphotransferase n=1 Tax=Oceanobacillus arenosus TaxID=1229153 RepID=A0A3D8PSN6_9BACI|nr:aminoglycoside phosphotransferase family protein [Oceanobacillus arenosus]RDW18732.1 aminoglycoside phosphotransferase [Oceanobacillus arenosus]